MTSNQQVAQREVFNPKAFGMFAGFAAVVAVGFVLFNNPAATARQTSALSGSGEVMLAAAAAPGAGSSMRDPSLPDAAHAFSGQRLNGVTAAAAPSF